MMLNLKRGMKKILFLDKGEEDKEAENSAVDEVKCYDRDIEELKIEVEALNIEVEKIKKKACRWRNIFLFLIVINLILVIYFGCYLKNALGV